MRKTPFKLLFFISTVVALVFMMAFLVTNIKYQNLSEMYYQRMVNSPTITENLDGVQALVIGNSITQHGECEYWWQECGMAASIPEKDYVHLLKGKLSSDGEYVIECINFAIWETTSHDRYQVLQMLNPYLWPDLELIIIQLGENMSDIRTADSDFEDLIQYVQSRCVDAEILVLGNFWTNDTLDQMKMEVSVAFDATYVSLKDIQIDAYYAGMGAVVYDENGGSHIIEHEGVSQHPGDVGMAAIAEKVFCAYKENRQN